MNKNRVNKVRFKTHFCASQFSISSCSSIVFGISEVPDRKGGNLGGAIAKPDTRLLGEAVATLILCPPFCLVCFWVGNSKNNLLQYDF